MYDVVIVFALVCSGGFQAVVKGTSAIKCSLYKMNDAVYISSASMFPQSTRLFVCSSTLFVLFVFLFQTLCCAFCHLKWRFWWLIRILGNLVLTTELKT